jgi:hypothetical protein
MVTFVFFFDAQAACLSEMPFSYASINLKDQFANLCSNQTTCKNKKYLHLLLAISLKGSELSMVMLAMIVSIIIFLMALLFWGCQASGGYWNLSLAYVHMTVDLYMFPICTYHFTCFYVYSSSEF